MNEIINKMKLIKKNFEYIYFNMKIKVAEIVYGRREINNKIVIDNFLGKGYGGDCQYIVEELLRRDVDVDIVWLVNNMDTLVPNGIRLIKYGSLESLKEFSTAKLWISNVRNTFKPSKRCNQYYLQIWHGSHPVKLIEGQVVGSLSNHYKKIAKKDGADTSAVLVDCRSMEDIYKKYFWFSSNTEYLRFGYLRNDYLINNQDNYEIVKRVRSYFEIDDDSYIVLYSPHF